MSHAPTELVVRAGDRELDGLVRPGESWLVAARRTCAALAAEPVPVDLSGETLVFAVDPELHVDIRAMTRDDLALAVRWRADPVVQEWWSPGEISTDAAIEEKYGQRVDGLSPTRMWVVQAHDRPVGFVQDYRLGDYPDYVALDGRIDPEAIGVDYAIGDADWRGRGLGVRMLWAWALRAQTRFPAATTYFAGPDHRNVASLRILAKSGFIAGATFEELQSDGRVDTVVGCRLDVATVLGTGSSTG